MRTSEELDLIVETAQSWDSCDGGYRAIDKENKFVKLSYSELNTLDKRLFSFLDRQAARSGSGIIFGDEVRKTRSLWRGACAYVDDINKTKYILNSASAVEDYGQEIVIYGSFRKVKYYQTNVVEGKTLDVPYVAYCTDRFIRSSAEWLVNTYPNWRTRWDAALALNLEDDEKASYMFTKTPSLKYMPDTLPADFDTKL